MALISRNLVYSTLLVLLALFLALGSMEVVTRWFFSVPIMPRFVVDSGAGIKFNQANIETEHYYPNQYRISITTNDIGLRGSQNYNLQKAPGTVRFALLGDSFLFGYGVNDGQVVSNKLQDILTSRDPNRKVEVLNFGVSGFGTAEELIAYKTFVRPYSPDFVGIFYFSNDLGNSIASDLFFLNEQGAVVRTGKSYLPGMGIRETLYKFPVTRWLSENSQAWNMIRNRISGFVWRRYLGAKGMKNSQQEKPEAVGLTRALMIELIREIRKDGATPFIVVIPGRRMTTNFPLGLEDVSREGVALIDGREFLEAGDYYELEGHWRPEGHAKAAAEIAQRFFKN